MSNQDDKIKIEAWENTSFDQIINHLYCTQPTRIIRRAMKIDIKPKPLTTMSEAEYNARLAEHDRGTAKGIPSPKAGGNAVLQGEQDRDDVSGDGTVKA